MNAIALHVLHTGEFGKCAIALLVTRTGKLGKCAPVDDCFSSLCIAYRRAWEVYAS